MQRHQRLQRMRARCGQRADVFAHQAALADVDELFGRCTLFAVQVVLVSHGLEIRDDALAQLRAVPRLEQQLVEAVRVRRRVLVELEALVLELKPAELFRHLQ